MLMDENKEADSILIWIRSRHFAVFNGACWSWFEFEKSESPLKPRRSNEPLVSRQVSQAADWSVCPSLEREEWKNKMRRGRKARETRERCGRLSGGELWSPFWSGTKKKKGPAHLHSNWKHSRSQTAAGGSPRLTHRRGALPLPMLWHTAAWRLFNTIGSSSSHTFTHSGKLWGCWTRWHKQLLKGGPTPRHSCCSHVHLKCTGWPALMNRPLNKILL